MIEMPTPVAAAVEKIARRAPLIHIAFGSPYMTASAPSAGAVLLAWSGIPQAQRAAARAVLGGAAVGGRLPISLLSLPLGHGIERAAIPSLQ